MRIDVSSRIDLSSFGCEILISEGLLGRCGGFFSSFSGQGSFVRGERSDDLQALGRGFFSGLQARGSRFHGFFCLPERRRRASRLGRSFSRTCFRKVLRGRTALLVWVAAQWETVEGLLHRRFCAEFLSFRFPRRCLHK